MKKILITGFKGKNNTANILLSLIKNKNIDKLELTNSFETSEKQLKKQLKENYDFIISFGRLAKITDIQIETVAYKNNNLIKTDFPYEKLETILGNIQYNISKTPNTYLCNNIYYEGMKYIKDNNLKAKMIFIHIPSYKVKYDLKKLATIIDLFVDTLGNN